MTAYFYHAETFTLSVYKSKLEKRIKSLIIPYVVWTILALVFVFSFVVGGVIIHNKSTDVIWVWIAESIKLQVFYSSASMISYDNLNWFGNPRLLAVPYLQPFWYVRDLIFMVLVSPLIYYVIKKMNSIIIIFFMLLYISGLNLPMSGLTSTSLFFFSLGAYLAINKKSITDFAANRLLKYLSMGLFLLSFTVIMSYGKNVISYNFYPLFVISLTVLLFNLMKKKVLKNGIQVNSFSMRVKKYSFFIYASHAIFGIYVANVFIKRLLPLCHSDLYLILLYMVFGLLSIMVCIVAFELLNRILPKTMFQMLTGGR